MPLNYVHFFYILKPKLFEPNSCCDNENFDSNLLWNNTNNADKQHKTK